MTVYKSQKNIAGSSIDANLNVIAITDVIVLPTFNFFKETRNECADGDSSSCYIRLSFLFSFQGMSGKTFKSIIKGKQSTLEQKINVDPGRLSKPKEYGKLQVGVYLVNEAI